MIFRLKSVMRLLLIGLLIIIFSLVENDPVLACSSHHMGQSAPDRPVMQALIPISNRPNPAEVLLNRGIEAAQRRRYEKAIALFSRAIAQDHHHDEAYLRRGDLYLQLGKYDAAIADFDQAIANNPIYNHLYRQRGIAKMKQGDLTGALADFDHAIKQYPEAAINYWLRGSLYVRLNQTDQARADLDQALTWNPNDSNAYAQRGLLEAMQDDRAAAAQDYLLAAKMLDPENWRHRDILVAHH
jgi:tetratricopeptide (TPR) repeat protein